MQKNHPSIGTLLLRQNIDQVVADALRKELRLSGYSLSSASRVVSGSIDRFYIDWVGFTTIDVEITISFTVTSAGSRAYSAAFHSHKQAPKSDLGTDTEAIKETLADCLHQFIRDAQSRGALR